MTIKSPRLTPKEGALVLLHADEHKIPSRVVKRRAKQIREACASGELKAMKKDAGRTHRWEFTLSDLLRWDESERLGGELNCA